MEQKYYLGVDVGSISTNLVLIDEKNEVVAGVYIRTEGRPIQAVKDGLKKIKVEIPEIKTEQIGGVGTTGSARQLSGIMVGADIIKDEITAHAVATIELVGHDVQTIFEIGGQDSKIIILREGIPIDFAMNTVCAAGTGSFIDNIATRINIDIVRCSPKVISCMLFRWDYRWRMYSPGCVIRLCGTTSTTSGKAKRSSNRWYSRAE